MQIQSINVLVQSLYFISVTWHLSDYDTGNFLVWGTQEIQGGLLDTKEVKDGQEVCWRVRSGSDAVTYLSVYHSPGEQDCYQRTDLKIEDHCSQIIG